MVWQIINKSIWIEHFIYIYKERHIDLIINPANYNICLYAKYSLQYTVNPISL